MLSKKNVKKIFLPIQISMVSTDSMGTTARNMDTEQEQTIIATVIAFNT